MIMPIKYTDEMVAEALAMRARGEKQVVIHATFGNGIEMAIRRVQARVSTRQGQAMALLQKVIDSGALAVPDHEALEYEVIHFLTCG